MKGKVFFMKYYLKLVTGDLVETSQEIWDSCQACASLLNFVSYIQADDENGVYGVIEKVTEK